MIIPPLDSVQRRLCYVLQLLVCATVGFFFFFFSSIDFYSLEYLKEQGKPTPYDLAVRASGGSIAAARAKANAGGFLEQIEAALPSTIQKAVVRWSDFNVSQMPPHSPIDLLLIESTRIGCVVTSNSLAY